MGLFHAIRDLFFPDGVSLSVEEPAVRKAAARA
jgi:hypothetical protein